MHKEMGSFLHTAVAVKEVADADTADCGGYQTVGHLLTELPRRKFCACEAFM
jgi:hypothetical protein